GPDSPEEKKEPELARIHIDEQGRLHSLNEEQQEGQEGKGEPTTDPTLHMGGSRMILHPPSMGGGGLNSGGLVGEAYGDPLTAPKAADPAGGQPGSDPGAPQPASPFMPPASASSTPPPPPFMPPSMTPPSLSQTPPPA